MMRDLNRMRELVQMLAEELIPEGDHHGSNSAFFGAQPPASGSGQALAKTARAYAKLRRNRERLFKSEIFADPAWDMLIDLFAAHCEGRSVSVSSACIASAVPATTALRWLGLMETEGLIERSKDTGDKRRTFVRITPTTYHVMMEWFDAFEKRFVIGNAEDDYSNKPLVELYKH